MACFPAVFDSFGRHVCVDAPSSSDRPGSFCSPSRLVGSHLYNRGARRRHRSLRGFVLATLENGHASARLTDPKPPLLQSCPTNSDGLFDHCIFASTMSRPILPAPRKEGEDIMSDVPRVNFPKIQLKGRTHVAIACEACRKSKSKVRPTVGRSPLAVLLICSVAPDSVMACDLPAQSATKARKAVNIERKRTLYHHVRERIGMSAFQGICYSRDDPQLEAR